ncbi:MAG TPA: PadR family transcriptional regulator [Vicinamibacterales bacterium]|jgi:DNA-binding PadR family transcriptional regulator|nr:PadR family transcriptional regulator [Vicinamibacterales bacterium]
MTEGPDPRSFLPLAPQDFQVLLGLAGGARHAYGLAASVAAEHDPVRLELGSLYRILARLTADGLIEETNPPRDEQRPDARRRYYRLTQFGRRVAAAETDRLEALLQAARQHRLVPSRRK